MSSSENSAGTLTVFASDASISVSDATFRPVPDATGVGHLSVRLAPGPYSVRARIGSFQASEMAVVHPGGQTTVNLDVQFESAAPSKGIRTTTSAHGEFARKVCEQAARADGPPSGLIVVLRDVGERPSRPFTFRDVIVRDERRRHVPRKRCHWERLFGGKPAAAWWARLHSGGYTLGLRDDDGSVPVEQSVWLAEGWVTIIFVPVSSKGPQLSMSSVHVVSLDDEPWDPCRNETLVAEVVLTGLRDGHAVLGADVLSWLKEDKYPNPMFGILAAYALLSTDKPDRDLLHHVVYTLDRMVGAHPDVLALSACTRLADHRRPGLSAPWPPMLAASYECLLEADRVDPAVLPKGSTAERIAPAQLAAGTWLVWSAMGDPQRRGRKAAAQLLSDHLKGTASRLNATPSEALRKLGTSELARRLKMPESLVRDGLKTMGGHKLR